MTNYELMARSRYAMVSFLKSLPVLEAPWNEAFQKRYCAGCTVEDCDNCPNEKYRNNPEWWLNLDTDEPVMNVTKRDFVENELAAMLIKTDSGVKGTEYLTSPDGEEYVILYFENGYVKNVCVTADSLTAIVRDVMKGI